MAADRNAWMLEADVRGARLEGTPLAWSEARVYLLCRDGRLVDFYPSEARNFRKTASSFRGYSSTEIKGVLEAELGRRLEVTGTTHYLVAHPPGTAGQWAERFEDLYRSFVHYFSVRGFTIQPPDISLVAVVWTDEADFFRYAAADGIMLQSGTLGYYSLKTNRIALFDAAASRGNAQAWQQNAATIIHEAAHQAAFNSGVHSRFAPPPRWLAEGLGTLFEAQGIWDSRRFTAIEDRINRGRLASFRQYAATSRKTGALAELVNSDRLFEQDPVAAYGEAWALTFFLSETQPRKYTEYLAKTAARERFAAYPAAQRLADFTSIFGTDLGRLEIEFLRYLAAVK